MAERRNPDELIRARSIQAHQLKRLVQREREIHGLRMRLDALQQWSEATVEVASSVLTDQTQAGALMALLNALVRDLGFDFACARWAGEDVTLPELEHEADRAFVASLLNASENIDAAAPGNGVLAHAWGLTIESLQDPTDPIRLVVALREDTLCFLGEHERPTGPLNQLVGVMVYPFDALRLRLTLQGERDGLESRVHRATKDLRLALARAERARGEAVRAASVRTQFLANMSHEIRTPMSAILGYADLLAETTQRLPTEQKSYIGIIRKSGKHLLDLLDDILDLSRIESGTVEVEPTQGSVAQLLLDVVSLLRVRAAEKSLTMKLHFSGRFPKVCRLDFPRVRQILLNIAGNAVKFTSTGSVELHAHMESPNEMDERYLLHVDVKDTGVGITPEALPKIFEAFEMERRAREPSRGTGLGLAISRRLAELMDGHLEAASTLGEGSTFTLRVPCEVRSDATWIEDPAQFHDREPGAGTGTTKQFVGRALVVEDTPVLREVVCAWLQGLGLDVATAEDGLAALAALEQAPKGFDIIFMDMQMPRMDGYAATEQLRDLGIATPVVALTAHAMAGERERCLDAGCTDYLSKPVDRDTLQRALETHLPCAQ